MLMKLYSLWPSLRAGRRYKQYMYEHYMGTRQNLVCATLVDFLAAIVINPMHPFALCTVSSLQATAEAAACFCFCAEE